MGFSESEKEILLGVKGVGNTVIQRLEQIGINSLQELSKSSVEEITDIVSDVLKSSYWRNIPQAKNAIKGAIECAKASKT